LKSEIRDPRSFLRFRHGAPRAFALASVVALAVYLAASRLGPGWAAGVAGGWVFLRSVREAELARLAATDDLTGLGNARAFRRDLARALAESARSGRPAALVVVDLDRFKAFNDAHGHPAGDEALRDLASILATAGATAYRPGGDEFALIATRSGLAEAQALAERLRADVDRLGGPITASFGVAGTATAIDPATLRRRADRALYRAKAEGGNRVAVHIENSPA